MYDLLVIGGGINGVGIARDAQGRGLEGLAGMLLPGKNLLLFVAVFVWVGAGRELEAARAGGIVHGVPVRAAATGKMVPLSAFAAIQRTVGPASVKPPPSMAMVLPSGQMSVRKPPAGPSPLV